MNVILAIGDGIEADAKDVAKFFETLGQDVRNVFTPRGLLALAMLAAPVAEAIAVTGAAAAQDGLNIPLDVESAELLVDLWPDLKASMNTLAVKPAQTKPPVVTAALPAATVGAA